MNQPVERIVFTPTKFDTQKGRWLLDSGDFMIPSDFPVAQSALVGFSPNGWAGDHRHGRREILFGIAGELYLVWRDNSGTRHEEKMTRSDGTLQAFIIDSQVPHLVENRSSSSQGALYEWSDLVDESIPLEGTESLRQ